MRSQVLVDIRSYDPSAGDDFMTVGGSHLFRCDSDYSMLTEETTLLFRVDFATCGAGWVRMSSGRNKKHVTHCDALTLDALLRVCASLFGQSLQHAISDRPIVDMSVLYCVHHT